MNNDTSLILFILNITMLFSYGCGSGRQQMDSNKTCRRINGNFDCNGHGNAGVRCGAHCPMEHIQGFSRSHWMPPLVDCSHRIAPAAAMVKEFKSKTQNTNKTQLLTSNYGTFWSLVVYENFNPKTDPLVLSSLMQWASCKCEMPWLELESSAEFLAIKPCQRTKMEKFLTALPRLAHICTSLYIELRDC